jgi:PPOX class probable FMN-dependent enzyme
MMAHDGGGRLQGQGAGARAGHPGAGCGFSIRRRMRGNGCHATGALARVPRIGNSDGETEQENAMTTDRDAEETIIAEPGALRAHMGPVNPLAERKVLDRLDGHCRDFIALSPFLVLATSDGEGRADASPRGDAPGFVEVVDERTLFIPDRRGNNRVDSFGNVLASPGVGLIFMVPGIAETLRVNGRARLTRDAALLEPATVQERTPTLGLLVSVEEAFFHCGKALIRSKLWDPASRVERSRFPSLGRIMADQTKAVGVAEAEANLEEAYRTRLY